MPCLPCGARKLSVRARLQMSATDVVRRTEMELKVDQKVLCGDIKRQETMGMELMERSKFDEYVRKTDELTRKTGEHVAGLSKLLTEERERFSKLLSEEREEKMKFAMENQKLVQENNKLTAKNMALTNDYDDVVLLWRTTSEYCSGVLGAQAQEEPKRALAAADAAELNSRP